MKSIRARLLLSYFIIIALLVLTDLLLLIIHIFVISSYRQVSDNIFLEFQLIDQSETIVSNYNLVRNNPNTANFKTYDISRQAITQIFSKLDHSITNPDQKQAYQGVKNTIQGLLTEVDAGTIDIKAGNIAGNSSHYAEATRQLPFVKDNTSALILKEIRYSQDLQLQTQRTDQLALVCIGALLVTIIIGCISVTLVFSRQLIVPLLKLESLAGVISSGKFNVTVNRELLNSKDEVGSLANSFNSMITKINDTLQKLKDSNAELEKTQHLLIGKNEDLERFNSLVVGREIKMIKLKETIAELREKIDKLESKKKI